MAATTRFRTKGSQTPSFMAYQVTNFRPLPEPTITGEVEVGCHSGAFSACVDVVKSGFKKTRDPSKWVSNPFNLNSIVAQASSGSSTTQCIPFPDGWYTSRTWAGDGVGFIFGPLVPSPKSVSFGSYPDLVDVADVRARVAIKCSAKINPVQSQGLVTVAEGGKSVSLILERAAKLAATWRYCRQGNIAALKMLYPNLRTSSRPKRIVIWGGDGQPVVRKNGRVVRRYSHDPVSKKDFNLLSDPTKLWLEYRYGWSPLVLDIEDTMKAIYAQELRDSLTPKAYTRVTSNEWHEKTQVVPGTTSIGGGTWTCSTVYTHKVEAHAYAKYQVTNQAGVMNRLMEFGLFDVPRATWELVPFSFVVDWFIPIGNYLAAIQPKIGVNVLDSGVTFKVIKTARRTLTGYTPDSTSPGSWPDPPFPLGAFDTFTIVSKNRTIGLPLPLFPPNEVKLNLKRITDAVALLRGVHRSSTRI